MEHGLGIVVLLLLGLFVYSVYPRLRSRKRNTGGRSQVMPSREQFLKGHMSDMIEAGFTKLVLMGIMTKTEKRRWLRTFATRMEMPDLVPKPGPEFRKKRVQERLNSIRTQRTKRLALAPRPNQLHTGIIHLPPTMNNVSTKV